MNNTNNELIEFTFRVNKVYENDKTIKLLGFHKNKETGVKKDINATIFKTKMDGQRTHAYAKFLTYQDIEGGLLLTKSGKFTMWKEKQQCVIADITGFYPSQFERTPQQPQPQPEAPKVVEEPWMVDAPKTEETKAHMNEQETIGKIKSIEHKENATIILLETEDNVNVYVSSYEVERNQAIKMGMFRVGDEVRVFSTFDAVVPRINGLINMNVKNIFPFVAEEPKQEEDFYKNLGF